jgi:hypothetical protein
LKLIDLGKIFSGIENLAEKCANKFSIPVKDMSLGEKLETVQVSFKRKYFKFNNFFLFFISRNIWLKK